MWSYLQLAFYCSVLLFSRGLDFLFNITLREFRAVKAWKGFFGMGEEILNPEIQQYITLTQLVTIQGGTC